MEMGGLAMEFKDDHARDSYIYGLLSGLRAGDNDISFVYSEILRIINAQREQQPKPGPSETKDAANKT